MATAALLALLSFGSIAGCQRALLALLGHRLPGWTLARAVLVATVVNRSVRSAGASGFAVLAWLLSRRGVPASCVLTSTAGHVLMSNALFASLFLASALHAALAAGAGGPGRSPRWALLSAAVAFVALVATSAVALLRRELRASWTARVARGAGRLGRLIRREAWGRRTREFLDGFSHAADRLVERRADTLGAWAWVVLRVATSLACLWACARAAGLALPLGVLVLTYTAAKSVGVIALVPAGLGLVEGSLAGALVAFGVPYEAALLVALLNRAVYHALPTALALVTCGPLVRESRLAAARWEESREAGEPGPGTAAAGRVDADAAG